MGWQTMIQKINQNLLAFMPPVIAAFILQNYRFAVGD